MENLYHLPEFWWKGHVLQGTKNGLRLALILKLHDYIDLRKGKMRPQTRQRRLETAAGDMCRVVGAVLLSDDLFWLFRG